MTLSSDCFALEELKILKSFDGRLLTGVEYYLWANEPRPSDARCEFLMGLKMIFEGDHPLVLTSGENSLAIGVTNPGFMAQLAEKLQKVNQQPVIRRISAGQQPIWQGLIGKVMQGIHLSRHSVLEGYANDALLFDFDQRKLLVKLSDKEGLEAGIF